MQVNNIPSYLLKIFFWETGKYYRLLLICLLPIAIQAQANLPNGKMLVELGTYRGGEKAGNYALSVGTHWKVWKFLRLGGGIRFGYGEIYDPKLIPAKPSLRKSSRTDTLTSTQINSFYSQLYGEVKLQLRARWRVRYFADLAGIAASNSVGFNYSQMWLGSSFLPDQSGRVTLSSFRKMFGGNVGTLTQGIDLQYAINPHIWVHAGWTLLRIEYTTYRLLNDRNDRFYDNLSLWGVGIAWEW